MPSQLASQVTNRGLGQPATIHRPQRSWRDSLSSGTAEYIKSYHIIDTRPHTPRCNCKSRGVFLLSHVPCTRPHHITCLLASLSERALSALDCFGDRCNTAPGLDEYGTASHLSAHLPLILTEIAVPASCLPIDIQVTPSPPSGSIILLLWQGGHNQCT